MMCGAWQLVNEVPIGSTLNSKGLPVLFQGSRQSLRPTANNQLIHCDGSHGHAHGPFCLPTPSKSTPIQFDAQPTNQASSKRIKQPNPLEHRPLLTLLVRLPSERPSHAPNNKHLPNQLQSNSMPNPPTKHPPNTLNSRIPSNTILC